MMIAAASLRGASGIFRAHKTTLIKSDLTFFAGYGGWRDVAVDDSGVVNAAQYAVRTVTQRENVKYSVLEAKSQVKLRHESEHIFSKQLIVYRS